MTKNCHCSLFEHSRLVQVKPWI